MSAFTDRLYLAWRNAQGKGPAGGRRKGGYGGCGPHGGQVAAGSHLVRGPGSALPGSPSCPEKRSSKASE